MKKLKMDDKDNESATYQIMVSGKVDPLYIEKLQNFEVNHDETGNTILSTLVGNIKDQKELLDVLNVLFDYQYELIFVMKVDS